MQILLSNLLSNDPRFSKKDAIYFVASLSRHKLSIAGYIVYYKDGRRFDFKFKETQYNKLRCYIEFSTVIDVVYKHQYNTGMDLKDALARALIDERAIVDVEFESKRDRLRPTKVSLILGEKIFITREFTVSG